MRQPGHLVFLSYASEDLEVASTVLQALEERGFPCWMAPRDILPGTPYPLAILEALQSSRLLVLVFSSHADASPQVQREVERAVSKGVAVIPYRIEDVPPSGAMEYLIGTTHWLDGFAMDADHGREALVEAVRESLEGARPRRVPRGPESRPWGRSAAIATGQGALVCVLVFGTLKAVFTAISGRSEPAALLGEALFALAMGLATGLGADFAGTLLARVMGRSFLAPVFARGLGGTLAGALVEALSGAGLWGLFPAAGGVGGLVAALGHRRTGAVVAGSSVGGYFGYLIWVTNPTLLPGPEWGLAVPLLGLTAGAVVAALADGSGSRDALAR